MIQRTCQNSVDGTLGGNSNIACGESAIYEMVKEPRFMRRGLAETMLAAVERFPDNGPFARQVTFLPSFEPNVGYVLLQLRAPDAFRSEPDYREKRQTLLEIACGAAKNKFPHLVKIIGIGIDAPKFSGGTVAEDFILMPCEIWPEETKAWPIADRRHPTPTDRFPQVAASQARKLTSPAEWPLTAGRPRSTSALGERCHGLLMAGTCPWCR